jgi:hypothetical protein
MQSMVVLFPLATAYLFCEHSSPNMTTQIVINTYLLDLHRYLQPFTRICLEVMLLLRIQALSKKRYLLLNLNPELQFVQVPRNLRPGHDINPLVSV